MKIHHIRNASFVIESGDNFILIDPMLGKVGFMPPFAFFRFKAKRNPTVELPKNSNGLLEKVTHCMITHLHPDHIDSAGKQFLKEKNIPVVCSIKDAKQLNKEGLNVTHSLKYWQEDTYLGGKIVGVPAKHGYGFVASLMGNVIGYYLELPNAPSIYISADTIYTEDVNRVLLEFKPDLTVLATGRAQFDFGKKLIMNFSDIHKFIEKSPHKVYANHMESLNHCPTTRAQLNAFLEAKGLSDKVFVPEDGETINL